jgi:hypothetical protein
MNTYINVFLIPVTKTMTHFMIGDLCMNVHLCVHKYIVLYIYIYICMNIHIYIYIYAFL